LADLAVVTVSHDDRMDFLVRQGERLAGEAAVRAWVVVANGNARLVSAAGLKPEPRIVKRPRNSGSAVGFAMGIEAALEDAAVTRILLLDADNLPVQGVIDALLARREDAVAAYRPRLYWAAAHGIDGRRADSCLGFHLFDLPAKIWRRVVGAPVMRERVVMPSAGYGGLMVSRGLVERIGLPDPQFVLYGDDTEWTMRAGGVALATELMIEEMDRDDVVAPGTFALRHWLGGRDGFRLFYGARNEAFIDVHRLRRNRLVHAVNRAAVIVLLRLFSRGRERQFALLREAMADGEAGRLGLDERFPLPEVE
jgi:hypothetical protein